MATSPRYTVRYRRKREGKTDYKKRLALLSSGKPRIVIRRSLKNIWLQIVEFDPKGDKVLVSAHSRELIKYGWKASRVNMSAAYICGLILGKKAAAKGIKEAVLDLGMNVSIKGGVWYAALKGCLDAGLNIPHSKGVLPDDKRIGGEHVASWANALKAKPDDYKRTFSHYIKSGLVPEELPKHVGETKAKVTGK